MYFSNTNVLKLDFRKVDRYSKTCPIFIIQYLIHITRNIYTYTYYIHLTSNVNQTIIYQTGLFISINYIISYN